MVSISSYQLFLLAGFAYLGAEWFTLTKYKESFYHRLLAAAGIVTGAIFAARVTPPEALPWAAYAVLYIRGFMLLAQIVYFTGRRAVLRYYGGQIIRRSQNAVRSDTYREQGAELEPVYHQRRSEPRS